MGIIQLLKWLLLAAEIAIALPIAYVCFLAITAIVVTKKCEADHDHTLYSSELFPYTFAILIPAHNEEFLLGHLLESLSQLIYPHDQYSVYVIADNCDDKTAETARQVRGVQVYERFDADKRGKGQALKWMLLQLEERQLIYDAYLVLDSDAVVDPLFLNCLARELVGGARALQARYSVLNATESSSAALRWIGVSLHGHVRPLSRSRLGSSSTLLGNGMCFTRQLLECCPWQAYSLSEDYEYYLTLVQHGERVQYVPDAVVHSPMPTTFAAMRTQDIRWESMGSGPKRWQVVRGLAKAGMKYRSFACFEAIAEFLTPPLSFLMSWCLLILIGSLLLWSLPTLFISLLLIGGLMLYMGSAFYLLRPPRAVYKALLYAPSFMIWKLWVLLVLTRSKRHTSEWIRTSRPTA